MVDCSLVASSDFDDLSFMAQALYVRLLADTDDMGVAEAGAVVRLSTRMRTKALDELIDNGFVTLIRDKGKIVYINGFHDNNFFSHHGARKSRYMTELQHNGYTKNVINKLKIKDDSFPRLGNVGNGTEGTGEELVCNAQRFEAYAKTSRHIGEYPMLYEALMSWYKYTDERGFKGITDSSIDVLVKGCFERCENVGTDEVCDYIDNAIASGYNNVNWSWFDNKY